MNLDEYEDELLSDYEAEKLKSVGISENEKKQLSKIASNTLKKNRRVNIRLSEHDLQAIQRKALQEGLPYQTLISSLIHKYTNGLLVDKTRSAS
jgi:predicted DNA binding CopG/RHH family protein